MPRDCFRSFYTCSPPASSTGTLDAIRCERYTHALFKNREGPDSPTRRFAVWDLSVEMVSSLMTLIQNFNHYSFLLLFSAPPPRSLSLSREGILRLYSLLSHWIFHKSTSPCTHTHTADFLTDVLSLSFPHALHICHLSCFVSVFHSSLFFWSSSSQSYFLLFFLSVFLFVWHQCSLFILLLHFALSALALTLNQTSLLISPSI